MTNREKAIEALDKDIITLAEIIVHYSQDEWLGKDEIQRLRNYITQPTLDDAIAVVESMKNSLPTLTSREKINVYKRVLTALKGLKEGK